MERLKTWQLWDCAVSQSLSPRLSSSKRFAAALCGLSLSALVFIRSFYVAWYPVLWIAVAWFLWCGVRRTNQRWGDAVRLALVFRSLQRFIHWPVVEVRNCIVLKMRLCPTGTQGGIGIADGFS